MTLRLAQGNLVEMEVDAIVNAANNRLARGGGVCGAVFEAAGEEELAKACGRIGFCPTGGAVLTSGFKLKARHVIHTVGPVWRGGLDGESELLRSSYWKSLTLAADNGFRSIAFPLISAGIFGYPRPEALEVAMRAVTDYFAWSLESGEDGCGLKVHIVFLGEASDLADREFAEGLASLSKEVKLLGESPEAMRGYGDPAGEIISARASGGLYRLALAANMEPHRLFEIAKSPESVGRSEVLALAVALGWRPGQAKAALAAIGQAPGSEPDWLVVAHYLFKGVSDLSAVNRSLFGLGLPILP
ncbi:MAG: macro domain-containing protein [Deltaproteobacteria bacterium]|jgi:O-acetyl-ADP-ribose deacetylase (regulator of RNase III)|nr:macro domain-containing protein [Deltaproteobacteria bacterium]